VNLLTLVNAN